MIHSSQPQFSPGIAGSRGSVFDKLIEYSMIKLDIFGAIMALLSVAACVLTVRTPMQHTVRILDAETGAPISGAVVNLHYYPSLPEASEPDHPRAVANTQGEVTLPSKDEITIWQVQADGYIEQRLSSNEGTLPPRYAAHADGDYDGVIHLYQLPEPQLNILLSDSYTGPLTIRLQPAPGFDWVPVDEINVAFGAVDPQVSYIQEPAGTRNFTATASADGVVDMVVAPLLYDLKTEQLQIRDNASVLPFRDISNPQDIDRGVWGIVSEDEKRLDHRIMLFVGTLAEYLKYLESGW